MSTTHTTTITPSGFITAGRLPMDQKEITEALNNMGANTNTAAGRLAELLSSTPEDIISFPDIVKQLGIHRAALNAAIKSKVVQNAMEEGGWNIGYRQAGSYVRGYFIRGEI